MNKKKLYLIVAAVLVVAAALVLICVFSAPSEAVVVDAEATYGNYARQKGRNVLVILDKNGHEDYDWIPVTDEYSSLTVKKKSNGKQGEFLIAADDTTAGGDITFRLVKKSNNRCIYQLIYRVYRDEDNQLSVMAKEHTSYGEELIGGQETEFPFVSYAEDRDTLIVEVTPADGKTDEWTTEADEDVFAVLLITETEHISTFRIDLHGEEEKTVKLCKPESNRMLSLVLGRDDAGLVCVKSSTVADYTAEPVDSSKHDSDRETFQAEYGRLVLPEGAIEEEYKLETVKEGRNENETYPCASMSFEYQDDFWMYLSAVDVSLADFSAREKAESDSTITKTIAGVEVVFYTIEDAINAFWAKDGRVYSLSCIQQTAEAASQVVQALMGQ